MAHNSVVLLENEDGRKLVKKACRDKGLHFDEFCALVQAELTLTGKQQRRVELFGRYDDILDRIQSTE